MTNNAPIPADPARDEAALAEVPLTVAAVAARLGVAPSTLRTWDRRYGLGPSGRSAGSHRRYTPDDVARLETMRRLTLAGAAPSDAARVAAKGAPGRSAAAPLTPVPELSAPARVDGLTLAAAAVDGAEPRVRGMLAVAVRSLGVLGAWLEVGQPALGFLADREPGDRAGRDPETLLAGALLAVVCDVALSAEDGASEQTLRPRVAVLADSAISDRLGAHVLAAALAQSGVSARVFTRVKDINALLRGPGGQEPAAICIVGNPPDGERLARASGERGHPPVFLVGADSPEVWLPGVLRVRTLPGAVHEIADLLGAVTHGVGAGGPGSGG